ncbi:peptidylprolyl isomerase [Orrella daihaiensis]|uniref:peptidylprolyl isomerase n=1 Tax=Orrella daihaiensis TaxID=2782176 RepID=A0ABY4ALK3_9BURK|nr:peptidyl-prolyl cis-trans isomerase [Orrella daihaiensis]UOD49975.1 peptidyl-prolyl cis-trans isomerase [Orrella daihaiensis]
MIQFNRLGKTVFHTACLTVVMLASTGVMAQGLPSGTFATVNGQPLSDALLDVNVRANVARGQADTPQLRQALQNELIGREVLAQEAQKLKLEQSADAQAQWQQMEQNFLANLLLNHYAANNPVTQDQIKAEYQEFLDEVKGQKQYKLSLIVVPTQERARQIIAALNKDKNPAKLFADIAAAESTDPSKDQQGALEWLLPQQMVPAVGNVVVNLGKGQITAAPLQTRMGWNVVRVDDIRDYTPPAIGEIENQLRQAAAQQQLSNYIQSLQEKAKIVR